jgi:TolB-like protein/class 3 adenylate cyclase/Flp pilus assembly protein TadD
LERRLAAILAADVVGYSRLMGADEAGTLEALKAHRAELIEPKAAQYGGRTIKLMGDGTLMEFPSVVDAVAFAVEVQCAVRERNVGVPDDHQIRYRTGINIGDVIVEGDDIYGDGVNVAARLEGLAEPDGICVSNAVYEQIRDKLDLTLEDLGEVEVRNITRAIRAFRVVMDEKAEALMTAVSVPPRERRLRRWLVAAASAAIAVATVATLLWWQPWAPDVEPASIERMAFPLPDKPSIAVLPFATMSGEKEQEYFADGMTEDLITDLSKVSGLFVIARNSVFTYKGRAVKIKQVAEELGVRYVLEGSVRRASDTVRINAQLIDATTGGHLWAERYDGTLTDVFALQDRVTSQIVSALAVHLAPGEQTQQKAGETDNPQAYDAFLKGWELYHRFTPKDFAAAIPHLERAIELDPDYGRAHAALATLYWETLRQGEPWSMIVNPNSATSISLLESRNKAQKYLDLAMRNPSPLAYRLASAISWDYRQFSEAVANAEQAISLDPNDPDGHVALAWAMVFSGRPEEALEAVDRAKRLDPRGQTGYLYVLGMVRFGLGQFQQAADILERAHEYRREYRDVDIPLAAAYAHLGRAEEARVALSRYTQLWRTFANDVDGVMGWWPFKREIDVRRFGGGLVQAGLCCVEKLEEYIARVRAGGTLE